MIRRIVRAALAEALAARELEAAYDSVRRVDPLLRRFVRRRLQRSLDAARSSTRLEDTDHLLRLSSILLYERTPAADFDDRDGIEREYAALPAPAKSPARAPKLSLLLALLVVVGSVVAVITWRSTRPFDPASGAAGSVLRDHLTAFVVAAAQGNAAEPGALDQARTRALGADAERGLGRPVVDKLSALLTTTTKIAALTQQEAGEARRQFRSAIEQVNRSLVEQQRPYYLDGEVLVQPTGLMPVLLSFYVQRDSQAEALGKRYRIVELWRLDELNVAHPYLGYTRPSTPAALVLLDQIETDLIRDVLPALGPNEPMLLSDENSWLEKKAWAVELNNKAGQAVRRHYVQANGLDQAALGELGRLLARRRVLVTKWRSSVRGLGLELRVPERLVPEFDYADQLKNRVPSADLDEWDTIHESLVRGASLTTFLELRRRYTDGVRRHELQHRIDFGAGLIPVPELLAKRLGLENPLDAAPHSVPGRARDEMSAYLAAIAHSSDGATLELLLLLRHLFYRNAFLPYTYAALGVLEGVSRELGLDTQVFESGRLSPMKLAGACAALFERSGADIQRGAAAYYQRAYGQALPPVKQISSTSNPEWRH